jgi:hypothetical protein
MDSKEPKLPPLEAGILQAMKAVDSQIARAMSRTPSEREAQGVQKWLPLTERVERVCALVMNALGDEEIGLDSVLVFAQAFPKALSLIVDDLGEEGLGKMRASYCVSISESIAGDAERTRVNLKGDVALM